MQKALKTKNHFKAKELLRKKPSLVNDLYEGQTALKIAIKKHDFEMVKILMKHGADPIQSDWGGIVPINYAIKDKRPHKYVEHMINTSKNPEDVIEKEPYRKIKIRVLKKTEKWKNKNHQLKILRESLKKYKNSDTAFRLIRQNKSLTFKEKDELFLLSLSNKNIATSKYLLNNGADPNAIHDIGENKIPAIVYALFYQVPLELIKLMTEKGLHLDTVASSDTYSAYKLTKFTINNLKSTQIDNLSILHFAIIFEVSLDVFDYLLENGVSIFTKDSGNMNALDYAVRKRNCSHYSIKILEKYLGIMKNDKLKKQFSSEKFVDNSRYNNFLIYSLHNSTSNVSEALLLAGASPNSIDKYNVSAITWAFYYKKPIKIIQLMIEKGLNLDTSYSGMDIFYQGNSRKTLTKVKFCSSSCSYEIYKISVLHYAIYFEVSLEIFILLLKAGAPPWKYMTSRNISLFDYIIKFHPQKKEFLKAILQYSENIPEEFKSHELIISCLKLHDRNEDIVLLLIKMGARLEKSIQYKTLRDLIFRTNCSLYFFKKLLKLDYGKIPIYKTGDICKLIMHKQTKYIETFLIEGADPNEVYQYLTPLYHACYKNRKDLIALLLRFGADPEMNVPKINGKAGDVLDKEEVQELLEIYTNYVKNYLQLYTRKENCDVTIVSSDDKKVSFHKLIFQCRLGGLVDYELFINTLKNFEKEEIDLIMKWIYGGTCNDENKTLLTFLISALNLPEEIFKEKSLKRGLKRDLANLYDDNDSKDFFLVVSELNKEGETIEREIPVHKLILIAHSELFREMFVNVDKESNRVHDYTGRSYEAIFYLIKYYYTDQLDEAISDKAMDELYYAEEFYQLSEYNSLFPRICVLKRKRKKLLKQQRKLKNKKSTTKVIKDKK
ncbi:ankyrin repeat-containing protein [Anaeramoeba flamelloides]|uniref:Ankyrin repeat-containing protein n=1 Tax=Anaeramoeba flamelloides TaxID=1746091 RepID=A0AAV7YF65_9EUKA|nr:ankyrin repeat-containing protein [Anaeramoeba flamelloides]